jgi:hypothetical protein
MAKKKPKVVPKPKSKTSKVSKKSATRPIRAKKVPSKKGEGRKLKRVRDALGQLKIRGTLFWKSKSALEGLRFAREQLKRIEAEYNAERCKTEHKALRDLEEEVHVAKIELTEKKAAWVAAKKDISQKLDISFERLQSGELQFDPDRATLVVIPSNETDDG